MQLHGRQFKVFCDVGVLDLEGLLHFHTLDDFCRIGAGRYGGTAPEGLEDCAFDGLSIFTQLDLQLHDISAGRRPNQARAHILLTLIERAHVPGIFIMVDDISVVGGEGELQEGGALADQRT